MWRQRCMNLPLRILYTKDERLILMDVFQQKPDDEVMSALASIFYLYSRFLPQSKNIHFKSIFTPELFGPVLTDQTLFPQIVRFVCAGVKAHPY